MQKISFIHTTTLGIFMLLSNPVVLAVTQQQNSGSSLSIASASRSSEQVSDQVSEQVYSQASFEISPPAIDTLRQQIAQKLFIDLRYYCEPKVNGYCQQAVTRLPAKLAETLSASQVGGVILFSENLQDSAQIVRLTQDLQKAILTNKPYSLPLYIGVDQEGGRVSRLPQSEYIGFAGNMAIGASAVSKPNEFAEQVGRAMAKQLDYLGFNVNFAPVLDVNSNPENPIINVRSFAQSPEQVGNLGGQLIKAMQQQGIAAAAKHFPGHGDTHIDSHIGLPVVNHSLAQIHRFDLAPFKQVIANSATQPDMIMTAHIQYPALDSTEFVTKSGERTILPATLSQTILTDLLRNQLAYKGLIITDSLEMAAITQFVDTQQAVIKAFKAGADITLMPFRISSAEDADKFLKWLDGLTATIAKDAALVAQIAASYQAIKSHKQKLGLEKKVARLIAPEYPQQPYDTSQDRQLAQALSRASFTQLKPHKQAFSPALQSVHDKRIAAIMPDKLRCQALLAALADAGAQQTLCISQLSQTVPTQLPPLDLLIVGDITPAMGFHESRATESISAQQRLNAENQNKALNQLISSVGKDTDKVLLKLRAPYLTLIEVETFEYIYASYDYQAVLLDDGRIFSPVFDTFVASLLGQHMPVGVLPVQLSEQVNMALSEHATRAVSAGHMRAKAVNTEQVK